MPRDAAPEPAHIKESASDAPTARRPRIWLNLRRSWKRKSSRGKRATGKTTMIVERSRGHATHVTVVEENDGDDQHSLTKDKDQDEEQKDEDATPCASPPEKK